MRKKLLPLLFLIGIFFFVGIEKAYAATEIASDIKTPAIWSEDGSPYIIRNPINVLAPLTVNPGVVVKFDYSNVPGVNAKLIIQNEFTAVGTADKKIIFTSIRDDEHGGDANNDGTATKPGRVDWSGITIVANNYDVTMEYVVISYARQGLYYAPTASNIHHNRFSLKYSELINNGEGIYISTAEPIIKNNVISNNGTGIRVYSSVSTRIPTFRNNSIVENGIGLDGRANYGVLPIKIDAEYNWWGDASGPYYDYQSAYEEKNLQGSGNRILGYGVKFRPWLQENNHAALKGNPIILVPGIGASVNWDIMIGGLFSDNWTMYDHTYDGIIEALKNMGYEEGKDLFICYYDWRKSNTNSAADYLKPLIDNAKALNGSPRVDVIAHSMGGLVTRSYAQSDNYAGDIDNLILIATPNDGSSDAYMAWEGGYIPKSWNNSLPIKIYLGYMNVKKHTFNNYETIHEYIPSVKQLMPVYDYLYDKNNPDGDIKNYSEMNEKNDFLEDLNHGIDKLNSRVRLSVIAGNNQSTLKIIPTISMPDENPLWLDGRPDPLDPEKDSTNGDGRVMLSSALLSGMFENTLNYNHGDIVSQSEKIIAGRILDRLDAIYPAPDVFEEMGFWFASPVDVEIKDPNGKVVSKSMNEIPLAKYSSESKADGFKMVVIPNPVKGDYEIKITGNGNGEYHIGSEYVDYQEKKQDSSSVVHGNITEGKTIEYKIAYNPENEKPVGDIKPLDVTPPSITGAATTEPNENGWYSSNVTVHFDASDDESGVESVTSDVIFADEGDDQAVIGVAVDKAGNSSSFTVGGINIDKTAPTTGIDLSGTKGENDWFISNVNIKINASDNLSGIGASYFSLDGGVYQTGDSLVVVSEGEHLVAYYAEDKAGNKEKGKEIKFKIDKSLPTIEIVSPQNRTYRNDEIIEIKYNTDDSAVSDGIKTEIFFDGRSIKDNKIDLSLEHLGAHTVSATARDDAGNNSGEIKINFESKTNSQAIIANVDHYFDLGFITSRKTKYILEIRMRTIENMMELLDALQNKWMPNWTKEKIADNLKRGINRKISLLIDDIRRKNKMMIDFSVRGLLVESLDFIKIE